MAGGGAGEEVKWWDVSYAPDGSDAEKTRFLRLHAVPEKLPEGGMHGTAVIIHGGYWKNKYGLDDAWGNAGTGSLAPFFLSRGFAAVELEYRRRDHDGGGWPGTNEDILLALQRLAEMPPSDADSRFNRAVQALRPERLLLVGHSAGGCLALWAGHQLAEAAPLEGLLPTGAAAPHAGAADEPHATSKGFVVAADSASVFAQPHAEAKKVGALSRGESLCGELRNGWVHLDKATLDAHSISTEEDACIPEDGAALDGGPLLQPSSAAAANVARRRRWRKGAKVQAAIVLALSPVADLLLGHELHVSDEGDAVERYMHGPPCEASRADYAKASPRELLPVPLWQAYVPRIREQYRGLIAEMYAYSLAFASLKVPHALYDHFVVSYPNAPVGEQAWPWAEGQDPCRDAQDGARKPTFAHYCEVYYLEDWYFSKRQVPHDQLLSCSAPLLSEPPQDLLRRRSGGDDGSEWAQRSERQAWFLCTLLPTLNRALEALRSALCPAGFNATPALRVQPPKDAFTDALRAFWAPAA